MVSKFQMSTFFLRENKIEKVSNLILSKIGAFIDFIINKIKRIWSKVLGKDAVEKIANETKSRKQYIISYSKNSKTVFIAKKEFVDLIIKLKDIGGKNCKEKECKEIVNKLDLILKTMKIGDKKQVFEKMNFNFKRDFNFDFNFKRDFNFNFDFDFSKTDSTKSTKYNDVDALTIDHLRNIAIIAGIFFIFDIFRFIARKILNKKIEIDENELKADLKDGSIFRKIKNFIINIIKKIAVSLGLYTALQFFVNTIFIIAVAINPKKIEEIINNIATKLSSKYDIPIEKLSFTDPVNFVFSIITNVIKSKIGIPYLKIHGKTFPEVGEHLNNLLNKILKKEGVTANLTTEIGSFISNAVREISSKSNKDELMGLLLASMGDFMKKIEKLYNECKKYNFILENEKSLMVYKTAFSHNNPKLDREICSRVKQIKTILRKNLPEQRKSLKMLWYKFRLLPLWKKILIISIGIVVLFLLLILIFKSVKFAYKAIISFIRKNDKTPLKEAINKAEPEYLTDTIGAIVSINSLIVDQ